MILADPVVGPSQLGSAWTFHPVLVAALAATALAYRRGSRRIAPRTGDRNKRRLAFYGGLALVAAALMSPLDGLSAALFSAHMVQHLVLMMVAAPLLAYARPAAALVAGLPPSARRLLRRAGPTALGRAARAVTRPLVVWAVGALALWSWHMPSLYEAALAHPILHVAEHGTFLGAGILFWSVVLASGSRLGVPRPVAALLVFATGVQGTALGATLLFASAPLYPVHDVGSLAWRTSPLEDQQLAGALMWAPPGLLYVAVMAWLLVRWFSEMDDVPSDRILVATGERP